MLGLIGLGLVGSALVERFRDKGLEIAGYDIDSEKIKAHEGDGFTPCKSPADVADKARRIVLSLPDSYVVNDVVTGARGVLSAASPGAIIVDTTTADPQMSTALAKRLESRSIRFLDATILGSSKQVRESDVLVMVGGTLPVFELCTDIFEAFSLRTFQARRAGSRMRPG